MNFRTSISGLSVFVILFGHLSVQQARAGAINLNGRWTYSDSSTGDDVFGQTYNASYSGRTDLTDNILLNGNLRYAKRITPDYDSDFIAPALTLDNSNDIYRFSLYGNYNYRTDSRNRETEGWNWTSNLGSAWNNPIIPSLAVSYGQRGSRNHGDTDSRNDFANGRTAWAYWNWLSLYYAIDWNRQNAIAASDVESDDITQRTGLTATQGFFDNRLRLNLDLNYLDSKTSFTGVAGDGGFALLPAIVSQASYQETADPLDGTLTGDASFLLADEDPPLALTIDPANDPMNLGVKMDFQQVDVIYLTIQNDIEVFADNFSWDLYSSNNGVDWQQQAMALPFVYDPVEQRFEFEISGLSVRWLKLVADTTSLLPLQITEVTAIEVFRKIFAGGEGGAIAEDVSRQNYQSRFGLSYQLMQNMRFSYNFAYDKTDSSQDENREKIDNNASLGWSPSRYLNARLNASETRELPSESPESLYRRYGFSIGSSPIDTLQFDLGLSMNEDYEEDELLERYYTYGFYTTAQLYQDLLASLDFTYTDATYGTRTDTFSERLELTARLRPTLIFTLDQRYDRNIDKGTGANRDLLTLNWRVSDMLYVNNTLGFDWGDDSETRTTYMLNIGIAPNRKNRFNLVYNYAHETETLHTFSGNWNWLMTSVLNFQLSGNYGIIEDGEDIWGFQGALNYSYQNSN